MFEHPDLVCPYCWVERWEECETAKLDKRSSHKVRLQLAEQPRLEDRDHRFSKTAYITTCTDCGGPVWVDKYGFIEEHPVPRKAVWCEGSLLRDLEAQGSDLHFTAVSAGAWEMNRSKH